MTNSEAKRKQNPWTKGEKALLGTIIGVVILALIGYFGWRRASDEPVVSIPTPTMPTPNAYDYFQSAAAMQQDEGKMAYAIIPWALRQHDPAPTKSYPFDHYYSPADKAALIQENAAALKMLRQGFAFPCRCPPVRSAAAPMTNYGNLRHLNWLLTLDGQVKQGHGDWNGAVQSQLDMIEMGEETPRGGGLLAMDTGTLCQSYGRGPLWKQIDHLDAAQAKAAAQRMQRISSLSVPFADVLQEEEWAQEAELLEMFRDSGWRGDWRHLIPNSNNYGFGSNWTRQQQAQMLTISKKTVMQDYVDWMDQAIREAHQPYVAHLAPPTTPLDPLTQEFVIGHYLNDFYFKDTQSEALNRLLMVTLALRAYRLEHGTDPASLSALVPAYLSRVPDDPFTLSGPLHYKRVGAKYVLYSVGPDGKDDGGKPIFDSSKPPPPAGAEEDRRNWVEQNSRGDVVAGVNF